MATPAGDAMSGRSPAPPPLGGGGGGRSVAPSGGGSWRTLSPERAADIALATTEKTGGFRDAQIDAARKRQGVTKATAPGGGEPERALSSQMLTQKRTGDIAAIVLGGAGVVGSGIAIARGGAWWLSLLLLPAAGAAYYFSRPKVAPVSK